MGGEIKVWCHYIDGDGGWVPIEEAKEDCKIFLGAYAKEKNLFGQPGWGKTDGYWLEEVHDVMCKQKRSNEISRLTCQLYGKFRKAFDDGNFGVNNQETIIWGRAFKQSLDIERHGGVLKLPLHLYRKISPNLQKYVELV